MCPSEASTCQRSRYSPGSNPAAFATSASAGLALLISSACVKPAGPTSVSRERLASMRTLNRSLIGTSGPATLLFKEGVDSRSTACANAGATTKENAAVKKSSFRNFLRRFFMRSNSLEKRRAPMHWNSRPRELRPVESTDAISMGRHGQGRFFCACGRWLRQVQRIRARKLPPLFPGVYFVGMIPINRWIGRRIVRSILWGILINFPLRALLFLHFALFDALHFFLPFLECGRHTLSFTPKCCPGNAGTVKPFTKKGELPARLARLPRGIAIILIREAVAPAAAALAPSAAPTARAASPARAAEISRSTRRATLALRPCFVDFQIAPANFFTVQCRHGLRGFRVVGHFHERKAARAARLAVHGHVDARHLAERREELSEIALRRLEVHVANKQTLHLNSPCTLRSTTSAGPRQTAASRTLRDVDLNWLKFVEGQPCSAPLQRFRQSCFRSLPADINTFRREAPHADFEPALGLSPRREPSSFWKS